MENTLIELVRKESILLIDDDANDFIMNKDY